MLTGTESGWDYRLVVLGQSKEQKRLDELVESEEVTGNFETAGQLAHEDLHLPGVLDDGHIPWNVNR